MRKMLGVAQRPTENPRARNVISRSGRKAAVIYGRFCALPKRFCHNLDEMPRRIPSREFHDKPAFLKLLTGACGELLYTAGPRSSVWSALHTQRKNTGHRGVIVPRKGSDMVGSSKEGIPPAM